MTGHLLGGAGALESMATLLALYHRKVPPTINLDNPEPGLGIDIATKVRDLPAGDLAAINNSFGFGGHNVAVAFTNAYATSPDPALARGRACSETAGSYCRPDALTHSSEHSRTLCTTSVGYRRSASASFWVRPPCAANAPSAPAGVPERLQLGVPGAAQQLVQRLDQILPPRAAMPWRP